MNGLEDPDDYISSSPMLIDPVIQKNIDMLSVIDNLKKKNTDLMSQLAELECLRQPPYLVATVIDVGKEYVVIMQHGNNTEFAVKISDDIRLNLLPGDLVLINAHAAIICVLKSTSDQRVRVMELTSNPDVLYSDIGGLEQQLMELREVVELPLNQPEVFRTLGIEPPRGVLLYGPPGTGKSLAAKAVATATNATFIQMAATELVQKFIGEGARLVRDLFQMARDKAPSIIFIDEIDAVAAVRTNDGTTGSSEVFRTMMQLLSEMDGFKTRGDIKIIAATNRIDILDPAILRPGRFDRLIEVPLADEKGRLQILSIHTKNMPLDDVDLKTIAKLTEKMNGAQLKAIATEAGMNALREKQNIITQADFINAVTKISLKKPEQFDRMCA